MRNYIDPSEYGAHAATWNGAQLIVGWTILLIIAAIVLWLNWPKKTGVLSFGDFDADGAVIVKRPAQAEIDAAIAKERAEERARVARKAARRKAVDRLLITLSTIVLIGIPLTWLQLA